MTVYEDAALDDSALLTELQRRLKLPQGAEPKRELVTVGPGREVERRQQGRLLLGAGRAGWAALSARRPMGRVPRLLSAVLASS
jgi:hypothetical protein